MAWDEQAMDTPETNSFKSKGGPRRLWHACRYSCDGLVSAFRVEAAFRQLLLLALILIPLAVLLPVSRIERILLVASVLISLIIELLNSAIEAAIDRISLETHSLSKRAKDMGSAAQLLGLINIAVVWGMVLVGLLNPA